jgi:hypothetical protein
MGGAGLMTTLIMIVGIIMMATNVGVLANRVSAAAIMNAHYHRQASLSPREETRLEQRSDGRYLSPEHNAAAASADVEEEDGEGAFPQPPPLPPSPPYDSVMLEIEQRIGTSNRHQTTEKARVKTHASSHSSASVAGRQRMRLRGESHEEHRSKGKGQTHTHANIGAGNAHRHRHRLGDPFPEQSFTYKDVDSPPDWLVPEKSEPAGPTTKPPPVPQMIPPPPPVPFPTYNYHDPNSAGPFSQYAPGVQGWGYDGGYAGPYDGFSMYGQPPNPGQTRGWGMPSIPRTAAQINAATAASQYHPYGAPPPLYSMGNPPPDGASSWVPLGAFLKPNTLEGGSGED